MYNDPSAAQRIHAVFDPNPQSIPEMQTPARPTNDLLISFETPITNAPNQARMPINSNTKPLLDVAADNLLAPTPKPNKSHDSNTFSDRRIQELVNAALENERSKWQQDAVLRHAAEMEALAADLHTQYRDKHTRKVEALKVTYKKQYEKKIAGLEDRVKEMGERIEELKAELERERQEKSELIDMSEELMRLTGTGDG